MPSATLLLESGTRAAASFRRNARGDAQRRPRSDNPRADDVAIIDRIPQRDVA